MEFLITSLRNDWETFLSFSPRLIYALALMVVFVIAGNIMGRAIARLLRRSDRFRPNERFGRTVITWVFRLAGVLLALGVMGFKGVAASLLATGGVVAVVIGFAFREIGENLLAGLFLAFSRPFEVGDLIKTSDLTGTVRYIDIRSVHIRTADACDVFVPSAQIFTQPLYNYTRDGLRRQNFTVGVAYHDEPEEVVDLLRKATCGVVEVLRDPDVFVTVKEFTAAFVEYEIFFFLDMNVGKRGIVDVSNDVKAHCWRALREAGMTFSTDVTSGIDIRTLPPLAVEKLS